MAVCEKCWNEAVCRADSEGGTVSEHYVDILRERGDEKACSPAEQCGDLHVIPIGYNQCRCGKKKEDV